LVVGGVAPGQGSATRDRGKLLLGQQFPADEKGVAAGRQIVLGTTVGCQPILGSGLLPDRG
jgi:hypothetical protein